MHHEDEDDLYESLRIKPVEFLSYDKSDGTIQWKIETRKQVRLGSVTLTPLTDLPEKFHQKPTGRFFIIYCGTHFVLYRVIRMDGREIKE